MASGSTQVKYLGIYQKIKQQILDGEYKINEKFRVAPSLLKNSMFQHLRLKALDLLVETATLSVGAEVEQWYKIGISRKRHE